MSLFAAVASLALLPPSPGLDTPITLDIPNAPVPVVAKMLEEASGVKIRVRGAPELDWVYLNVKDRPLRLVLDGLASLCDARWSQNQGDVIFQAAWPGVDPKIAERERAISAWLEKHPVPPAMTADGIKEVIREALEVNESQLPNRAQRMEALHNSTALPRAAIRVLHSLGAKELSLIARGDERTYTTQATGRSQRLPASLGSLIPDLMRERKTFQDQLSRQGLTWEDAKARGRIPYIFYFYFEDLHLNNDWCVTIRNNGDDLMVKLRGFGGEDGVQVMESVVYVAPLQDTASPDQDGFAQLREPFAFPQSWIEARVATNLQADLLNKEIDAPTMHIDKALQAARESLQTDLMAIIPDGAFIWASANSRQGSELGVVLRGAMLNPARLRVENGLATIRPLDLYDVRTSRVPRAALARYVRTFQTNGAADIDMIADLAVAAPYDQGYWHSISFLTLAGAELEEFYEEPDLLRMYGGLASADRERAREGGLVLPYRGLSNFQKNVLERLLNASGAGLDSGKGVPEVGATTYFNNYAVSDIKLSLPATLPGDTPILIRVGSGSGVFARDPQNPDIAVFQTSPGSLAYFKVFQAEKYAGVRQYALCDLAYLQVAVDFAPLGRFSRSSPPAGTPGKSTQWLSFDELPESFRSEYEQRFKENLERKKTSGG